MRIVGKRIAIIIKAIVTPKMIRMHLFSLFITGLKEILQKVIYRENVYVTYGSSTIEPNESSRSINDILISILKYKRMNM